VSAAEGEAASHGGHGGSGKWALVLGALGIVFGDIGTSPLYAIKECFSPENPHRVEPTEANVLGILSLVFWSLAMVVTVKYLTFIMRADNEGSGGILALLALLPPKLEREAGGGFLVLLVLFGAALLYGDGVITPAISVLSAVEGLSVATTSLKPVVLPLTLAILLGLFLVQHRGTAGVGKVFGPVMLLWFALIALLGVHQIVEYPAVLRAVSPVYAVEFFLHNGKLGFLVLGAVVLCITGGEALYADMGHFGRGPIQRAWFFLVWPALLANYFGQGALLLEHPHVENPFYGLVPGFALYPTVAIATAATVVASQALISGSFSLTQQAVQLGFFPRVSIVHTSKETEGQIYVPEINNGLLVACLSLVLAFRTSGALAAAYGIAVTGTMAITSICYYVVVTGRWGWARWKALPLVGTFLLFDGAFFLANSAKFLEGGWFPLAMAAFVFTVMITWKHGRRALGAIMKEAMFPLESFLADIEETKPLRVPGTAVFMASNPGATPTALLHNFKHNRIVHERVILLSVLSERVPEVPVDRRVSVRELGHGFFSIEMRFGFMQQPLVPAALRMAAAHGLVVDPDRVSYYLGRETLLPSGSSKLWGWQKSLFAFISRNARPATAYFGLPPNRVVELGMQVDL
jgi:KUP system potassium uptake protein